MSVWFLLKKWFQAHVFSLSNRNLFILLVCYVALCWLLLAWAGEQALTENVTTFVYYLMVTASTVATVIYLRQRHWVVGL